MTREQIPLESLKTRPLQLFDQQWMLVTSGDYSKRHFNSMTISWGFMGTVWSTPVVQVLVRPTRYTFEFMEQYDTFTVCAFPKQYHRALQILGTQSGRDGDKLAKAGLTPIAVEGADAPAFAEAELILSCRKIYWQDIQPQQFLLPELEQNYPEKDYHRVYFGEVKFVSGDDQFRLNS